MKSLAAINRLCPPSGSLFGFAGRLFSDVFVIRTARGFFEVPSTLGIRNGALYAGRRVYDRHSESPGQNRFCSFLLRSAAICESRGYGTGGKWIDATASKDETFVLIVVRIERMRKITKQREATSYT